MRFRLTYAVGVIAVIWMPLGSTSAPAVTAELAKKCAALTAKAFPPRVIGNPASGSAQGSAREQQEYYQRCIASGSTPGDEDSKK